LKRIFHILICLVAFTPAVSATPLEKIEQYLNNLTTFQADFRQFTVNTPGFLEGHFYIQRPKQFLWQYTHPHQQKIVSTGTGAYFFDPENGQVTQVPINSGFASIFTQNTINFNEKDFKVHKQIEKKDTLEVVMAPSETTDVTELSFVLKKDPLQLQQIVSKDAFGDTTIVVFSNIKEKITLDTTLFDFIPPHYADE